MEPSFPSVDAAAAAAAATAAAAPSPIHPPVLAFKGQVLSGGQGPHGPLRNQLYPMESRWSGEIHTTGGPLPPLSLGTAICSRSHPPPQQPRVTPGGIGGAEQPQPARVTEVITVEDDEDATASSPSASQSPRQPSFGGPERVNGSSNGSSTKNNSNRSSSQSSYVDHGGQIPFPVMGSASGSLPTTPQEQVAPEDKEASPGGSGAPGAPKAFCGTHTKSLWLHGKQRPENIEKHLSDLKTKFSVGKVSMRNPIFPSAGAAAEFMRAVSENPRVTSLTLNAPEIPEDQFTAVCEGLGSCCYLNHVDCNAISSKPLRPAALQLLLQRLQMLPDLRELNISGNEFGSPGAPGVAIHTSAKAPQGALLDGSQLLKGLLLGGVLCLLARECGLRRLRQFLLWVLNRCHCLRLRQLDLGASSKLLTTLVPGETFDEELLRRVSRLSKSTWRRGKVIGDYAPSFQAVDLWKSHMAETFWLYSLLDAMVATNTPIAVEGPPKEGAPKPADTVPAPSSLGGTGRLPLIRVWGIPTDHTISTPAHAAYFRYGVLVARLGDRCLVRWIPLSAFLAAIEEDLLACEAAASRRQPPYQQGAPAEAPAAYGAAARTNAYGPPNGADTFQKASSSQASAAPQPSKHHQHQQRAPVGGRTSARLAGTGTGFGGGGQTDHLADTFGAYDACVEAARVEPAVFAFAAWRQHQRRHQQHQQQYQCLSPGQWVEVMVANKEDKRFFYSAIGVIQKTFPSHDQSTCFYRVEYLGLPPRSFTRLTLGGSPAPSDVAAVLRSTVRIAIVPEKKVRPLVFLLPNESWAVEALRARCGASNCVNLPDGYGIDFRCPAFGGHVTYAIPAHTRPSTTTATAAGIGGTACPPVPGGPSPQRLHIQLNCQHLEFAAKQLMHPRQLFCRFGLEGPVAEGGAADLFEPLGVTRSPPTLVPASVFLPQHLSGSLSPASSLAAKTDTSCPTGGDASPSYRSRTAGGADDSYKRCPSFRAPQTGSAAPALPGSGSPKARKRPLTPPEGAGGHAALPVPAEEHNPPLPSRKKQQKAPVGAPKVSGGSPIDQQVQPAGCSVPQEASVVVELSDDETPKRPPQKQQQQTAVEKNKPPSNKLQTERTKGPSGASADAGEREGAVDVGAPDDATWHSMPSCARCRMPLIPRRYARTATGAFTGATAGSPPCMRGEGPQNWGRPAGEDAAATAGVRRRFRAYVRRVMEERSQKERRRLDRLLEDLQLPFPHSPDPDTPSSAGCRSKEGSSSSTHPSKRRQASNNNLADQRAFERCLRILGSATAPASVTAESRSSSSNSSSSTATSGAPKQTAASCRSATTGGLSVSTATLLPPASEAAGGGGPSAADCSAKRAEGNGSENDVATYGCCCMCDACSCCNQRLRFCSGAYAISGDPPDSPANPLYLEEGTPEEELNPEEWELVRRALGILLHRGVVGLVAHDRASPTPRVRLLPLPRALPAEGSVETGATCASSATREIPMDGEELEELRRLLEQRRRTPRFWGVRQATRGTADKPEGPPVGKGDAPRLGDDDGVLCDKCLGEGWVSESSLPRLLNRYRSGHTDNTCNAPACNTPNGRCGCRGGAKRRRTTAAKPQVFGWSRNSSFHGISASAQACNMSQNDAEVTYSEYASMQIEHLQRSVRSGY